MKKNKIFLILIIPILFVAFSSAKYVMKLFEERAVESEDFYFECIELGDKLYKKFEIELKQETDFEFNIDNFNNDLLYAPSDISYNISIDNNEEIKDIFDVSIYQNDVKITDMDNLVLEGKKKSSNSYRLNIKQKQSFDEDKEIKIKVISTSPYHKELTLEIAVKKNEVKKGEYEINQVNDELLEVKIKFGDNDKKCIVEYNKEKIILDQSKMYSNATYNNNEITIMNSTQTKIYEILFIKKDDNINVDEDIQVEFV